MSFQHLNSPASAVNMLELDAIYNQNEAWQLDAICNQNQAWEVLFIVPNFQ